MFTLCFSYPDRTMIARTLVPREAARTTRPEANAVAETPEYSEKGKLQLKQCKTAPFLLIV